MLVGQCIWCQLLQICCSACVFSLGPSLFWLYVCFFIAWNACVSRHPSQVDLYSDYAKPVNHYYNVLNKALSGLVIGVLNLSDCCLVVSVDCCGGNVALFVYVDNKFGEGDWPLRFRTTCYSRLCTSLFFLYRPQGFFWLHMAAAPIFPLIPLLSVYISNLWGSGVCRIWRCSDLAWSIAGAICVFGGL